MPFSTIFLWRYDDFSVLLQKISIKLNAYETAESYFGDIGESETDKTGIKIAPIINNH